MAAALSVVFGLGLLGGCGSDDHPAPDAGQLPAGRGGSGGASAGGTGGHSGGGGTMTGGAGGQSSMQDAAADTSMDAPQAPTDTDTAPDGPSSPDAPASGKLCGDRKGGALVTLGACSPAQPFTLWITDKAFITEAIAKKGMKARIPVLELIDGQDCDPAFTWHVNPATATFADFSTEVCDGCPDKVEADKSTWLSSVKRYCPWQATVIDVEDKR